MSELDPEQQAEDRMTEIALDPEQSSARTWFVSAAHP